MDKYVMRDGQLYRDDGDGSGIVLHGAGVILRELNALQRRVEELEANIKEAVKEIEDSMQSADWEVASVYDGALLILKNHGLLEDK